MALRAAKPAGAGCGRGRVWLTDSGSVGRTQPAQAGFAAGGQSGAPSGAGAAGAVENAFAL
jgi:hypothetical protein